MSATDQPLLRIRGLRKSFGSHAVLHGVDLDVERGGVTALLGRSGSGKSTLLRCINRLEKPDAGYVALDGELIGYRPVPSLRHDRPFAAPAKPGGSLAAE